jgi:hypothetical protein
MESTPARIGFSSTHGSYEGDTTMITKTALIAVLTLGTVTVASASEFDGNLQNRYPQATSRTSTARRAASAAATKGEVLSHLRTAKRAISPVQVL